MSGSITAIRRLDYAPAEVGLTERVCALGDRRLNLAVGPPTGPPLVLLHGVMRCWQDFRLLIPSLAASWQVFALDFRGHGHSGWVAGAYEVTDYVHDMLAWLEQELPGPAVLFGHSLGAMVAAAAAVRLPSHVRGVILEDPPFSTLGLRIQQSSFLLQFVGMRELIQRRHDFDTLEQELAALPVVRPGDGATVRFADLRDAESIRFLAECLARLDPGVLDPLVEGRWLVGDELAALNGLSCPTLLLKADNDAGGMLSESEAAELMQLVPTCRRVDFPGVGHRIHETQPEQTLAAVQPFLQSIETQAPPQSH